MRFLCIFQYIDIPNKEFFVSLPTIRNEKDVTKSVKLARKGPFQL